MSNQTKKDAVWEKASPIRGEDPNLKRADAYGNIIAKQAYGKQSRYGWNFDHITPKAKGGPNEQGNIQPLHWKANRDKADK